MKKVWKMLHVHISEDYNGGAYLSISILLVVLLIFNYSLNFENSYVDTVDTEIRIPIKILSFLIPYLLACLVYLPWYGKVHIMKSRDFWVPVLFVITCIGFDSGFPIIQWVLEDHIDTRLYRYAYKVIKNLINIPFIIIPALIFYHYNKDRNNFYGLTAKFDLKPYLVLLIIVIPFIFLASRMDSFSNYYPMYPRSAASAVLEIPETYLIFIYEFLYAWNFVTVEFVFRGFLVIGMAHILGKKAIMPMVVLYCVYHFGKPAGEAISSIFGGYILGIIAYYSRSIGGGVILHIGIALAMELFGFLANG